VVRTATRLPQCGHGWTAVTPAVTSARCWAGERGQRAGLACLLRRAGRGALLGLAYRVDLVTAGREDTAAVQGSVAGRPELPGMRLAADLGY
jgi:hypothetical protein